MGKLQEKNIVHILFLQKVVIFVEIAKADMPECNDNLTGVPIWGAGHSCASYQSPGKEYCAHSEIAENCSFCGQCATAERRILVESVDELPWLVAALTFMLVSVVVAMAVLDYKKESSEDCKANEMEVKISEHATVTLV